MRSRMSSTFAAAALLGAAACSDAPTPTQSAAPGPQLLLLGASDTLVVRFTYDPAVGGTYKIGDHKLVMPAYSVCDPAVSTYGPTEWDRPCTPLAAPLGITAKTWLNGDGHPQIDFSPSLRFVPTDNSNKWVQLFFTDRDASDAARAAQLHVLWAAAPGLPGIDETLLDPTLKLSVNSGSGMIWRRIKHFTGYLVVSRTEPTDGATADVLQ